MTETTDGVRLETGKALGFDRGIYAAVSVVRRRMCELEVKRDRALADGDAHWALIWTYRRDGVEMTSNDAGRIILLVARNPAYHNHVKLPDYPFLTERQYLILPTDLQRFFEIKSFYAEYVE